MNIWIIGDSTAANKKAEAAPETGWGMVLQEYFKDNTQVHNHAVNGRSSKSFFDEGRWKPIVDSLQKGDYVVIQFGHNDEKADTARHTDPFTTYREMLRLYINETRSKEAVPLLCTSIVRRHFDAGGNLINTHGDYITATREVAAETGTVLIDMEAGTRQLVTEMGQEGSKSLFMFIKPGEYPGRPDGVADSTHLNALGAHKVAEVFIEYIRKLELPLTEYLK